jgi:type IV pilus assembly protein PilF
VQGVAVVTAALTFAGCASQAEREAEAERGKRLLQTDIQLAVAYLQQNNPQAAKERIERALKVQPDDAQANNVMAVVHWRLKDYDSADRHFQKALKADPKLSAVHHNYGAFLCDRQRIDDGLKHLEVAIADAKYNAIAEAQINAGVCLMKRPSPAAAEKYFREALKADPRVPVPLYYMAKINFDAGRTFTARGFMDRYFEVGEDTPEALLLATRIERALKNRDAEASYAVRLRGKFPTAPETEILKRELLGRRSQ